MRRGEGEVKGSDMLGGVGRWEGRMARTAFYDTLGNLCSAL